MAHDYWNRRRELLKALDDMPPPVLVGVPGSLLGIEVPFMPRPGRLHIVVPYSCDAYVDLNAMHAMRVYCSLEQAA